jgi:flagellar protein FliL
MDKKPTENAEPSGSSGQLQLLVILTLSVALVVPLAGTITTISVLGKKLAAIKAGPANAKAAEVEKAADGETGEAPKEVPLAFYAPLEFLVNLADSEETHYLRTTVSLAVPNPAGEEKPKGEHGAAAMPAVLEALKAKEPIIRDTIISVISSRSLKDLSTPAGKDALKVSLCQRLQEQLALEGVAIYFTAFTLQ